MGNRPNRIEKIVSIPIRGIGTGLTASADIFDTLAAIPKDIKDVVKYTSDKVKNVFKSATTKGKRYQKFGNTLLSPFVSLGTAVEGTIRSVVTPGVNFVSNLYKTGKNTLNNTIRSTFGSVFSKKPVSDFKYDELKTADVIKKDKNWFSKRRFGRKVFQNEQRDIKKVNNLDVVKDVNKTINNQKNTPKTNQVSGEIKELKKDINPSKKESEVIDKKTEHRGVEEAKRILSDSVCGKKIIDGLCERHRDFGIIFDDTTAMGHCNENNTITIGTQMPSGVAALAPFNWEAKNSEVQKKHLLLHELGHCVVHSRSKEIPGINEGLNLIKKYIKRRENIDGKTLSLLSYRNNSTYPTNREKAREDFVEMLALRMNGNGNLCKEYLNLLSDEEHKSFRESHGLATITKEDASKLQNIFDSIIHFYENLNN